MLIPSTAGLQQLVLVAFPVALFLGGALVDLALAVGEAELHFRDAAVVEIDRERNERHALALGLAVQLLDLAALQQELPRAPRLVVEAVGGFVFREIGVVEPDLAVLLDREGLVDADAPQAQRLHLGAGQHHAGIERVLDEEVMPRLAVLRGETIGGRVAGHRRYMESESRRGKRPVTGRSDPPSSSPPRPCRAKPRRSAPSAGGAPSCTGRAATWRTSPGRGWFRRTGRHARASGVRLWSSRSRGRASARRHASRA